MKHAYLIEMDKVVEEPGEVLINQFKQLEVVFSWNGDWYRIPFFVLEELLAEMIRERRTGSYELSVFLNSSKLGTWYESSIEPLKEAIEGEMGGMEAYKMY